MTINEFAQRRAVLAGLIGAAGVAAMVDSAEAAEMQPKSAPASVAADIVLIVNALNLYGLAIDSMQWHLFDLIFTPDAHVGKNTDLAQFKAAFDVTHKKMVRSQHLIVGHVVNVTGDTAQSWSYSAYRTTRKDERVEFSHDGTGYYDDQWVRTKAGWRINRRLFGAVWGGEDFVEHGDTSRFFKVRTEGAAGNVTVLKALAPK